MEVVHPPPQVSGLLTSLSRAIQDENWYSAIALALMLPDICGWIETGELKSTKRYIRWFKTWVSPRYTFLGNGEVFLCGGDAYALRCVYLHQGLETIKEATARERLTGFNFSLPHPQIDRHCNYDVDGRLHVNVRTFCTDVHEAAAEWWSSITITSEVLSRFEGGLLLHPMWPPRTVHRAPA